MRRALCLSLLLSAPLAAAQDAPAPDVNAAAAAFQEGQRLQLAREYGRAADFFEIADHAAPSPAALRSAIRSHQAAGHLARAATLALRARDRDAADPQSAQLAASVLADASPHLSRIHVTCSPACAVTVDQFAVGDGTAESHAFFVEPGARALETRWDGRGSRSRSLDCAAGQSVELSLDAPPPEPVAAPTTPQPVIVPVPVPLERPTPVGPPREPPRRPVSPVIFWIGLGATVAGGAVLTWSGTDTLSARDAYVQHPTEAGYNDGASLQTRTNALIATTAVLGVATAVVGVFFTDWSGSRRDAAGLRLVPTLGVGDGGGRVGVIGSF